MAESDSAGNPGDPPGSKAGNSPRSAGAADPAALVEGVGDANGGRDGWNALSWLRCGQLCGCWDADNKRRREREDKEGGWGRVVSVYELRDRYGEHVSSLSLHYAIYKTGARAPQRDENHNNK